MESVDALVSLLVSKFAIVGYILMGLGVLVVLGRSYVLLSPTKDDDAFYAKLEANVILGPLLKLLVKFSPVQRKEEVKE